ncbi:MAG TPA: DnaB-like helicase C-terminal domain-containing protein [Thermoanaerobaculia bacterium]|nr:DnaB-like helicase C-terminal domain-containing protein [Thermoanaerobaculia bacterium]
MPPRISGGGGLFELPEQQTLPHSEESERAVLGGLMLEPGLIAAVSGRLSPEEFYRERHEVLYRAMLDLDAGGVGIDLRTLQAMLERRGQFELVGGLAYLTGLDLDLPDVGRIDTYVDIVKETAARRELILLAGRMIRDAMGGQPAGEVGGALVSGVEAILRGQDAGQGFVDGADAFDALMAKLESSGPIEPTGCRTGIPAVDAIICAMKPRTLWLVAARQGVGKTAMLCQMIAHDVFVRGVRVGVFSLEMTNEELLTRIAAQALGIDSRRIEYGRLTQTDWTAIARFSRKLRESGRIKIDDAGSLTAQQVYSKTRQVVREHEVAAVYGDYLGLIVRPKAKGASKSEEVDEIACGLAALAKDLHISSVWMHQINRAPARDGNRPPALADLDQAGEKPAYGVMMLHRNMRNEAQNVLASEGSISIVKHRGGEVGRVETYYDGPHLRWWGSEDWKRRMILRPDEPEPREWYR